MYRIFVFLLVSTTFLAVMSCRSGSETTDRSTEVSKDSIKLDEEEKKFRESTKSLVYNMFLPCEMVYLFDESNTFYDPDLINPVNRHKQYKNSFKQAMNIGVYGVDMGYLRMNDRSKTLRDYSRGIYTLADNLGIPSNHISKGMEYFQTYYMKEDSLYRITCKLFAITDGYLHKSEREAAAAMIVFGGWVEAMYIAVHIHDNIQKDIMEKVGRQKYSLHSLISLLNMYQDNKKAMKYLVMLRSLKKDVYSNIQVYYEDQKDVKVDTVNKKISTKNAKVDITPKQFQKIKQIITQIRNKIVSLNE